MSLVMTVAEEKNIDSQVEQMLDWAKAHQIEAEQLSFDAVRLLSCTGDRLDKIKKQNFFKRFWSRFNGDAVAAECANISDMIQIQKISLRYLSKLQEQNLMMAHSLLSLKNNLYSLAVKEEETRNLINLLAQNTLNRFNKLEHRVDQLEISTNLQGWLLSLEERDYDEKYPTEYMRLFRVINDFYSIKNDCWNYNDLMFMRKAIRTVGIDPKRKLSLGRFIDDLSDEIMDSAVGFQAFNQAISLYNPANLDNYSNFVVENVSSPVFTSIHGLKIQYMDRLDVVEELADELQISQSEALKKLLKRSIANLGVNLDYEFALAETAIEILGSIRLVEKLILPQQSSFILDNVDSFSESEKQEIILNSLENKHNEEIIINELSTKEDSEALADIKICDINYDTSKFYTIKDQSIFFKENMNDEKLKNFIDALQVKHKKIIQDYEVLCLYDETLLGTSDKGVAVTKDHIYYNIDLFDKSNIIKISDIRKVEISGLLGRCITISGDCGKHKFILTQGNKGAVMLGEFINYLVCFQDILPKANSR